jgi:hypothetical protein
VDVVTRGIQCFEIIIQTDTAACDADGWIIDHFNKTRDCIGLDHKIAVCHDEVVTRSERCSEVATRRETEVGSITHDREPWSPSEPIHGSVCAAIVDKHDIDVDAL